jgi:hypothetical protein
VPISFIVTLYYEKHFEPKAGTDDDSAEEHTMCVGTAEPYVEPHSDVDIEMVVSKLKKWKSN